MADPITTIPPDMWGSLLRIEGTTARTEGEVRALSAAVHDLKSTVNELDAEFRRVRSDVDRIEAERAQQVPDFVALKSRVTAIERWQTEEQTTSRNAGKWGGAIWGACGSGVTAGLMFLASLYFQHRPAVPVVEHKVSETTTIPVKTSTR